MTPDPSTEALAHIARCEEALRKITEGSDLARQQGLAEARRILEGFVPSPKLADPWPVLREVRKWQKVSQGARVAPESFALHYTKVEAERDALAARLSQAAEQLVKTQEVAADLAMQRAEMRRALQRAAARLSQAEEALREIELWTHRSLFTVATLDDIGKRARAALAASSAGEPG